MAKKPRRGRPPLKPDDRRTYKLSVSIREKLRRLLEQTAAKEGRTLSKEVEFRIELSYRREFELLELAENALRLIDENEKKIEAWGERYKETAALLERIRREGYTPKAQDDRKSAAMGVPPEKPK